MLPLAATVADGVSRAGFPSVEVRIDVEATGHPIARVLDGTIRSGAHEHAGSRPPARQSRPVFDSDHVVVIASPDHRLGGGVVRVTLMNIREETLFLYPPRQERSLFLNQVLMPAGAVRRDAVEEVKLTEAIIELRESEPGRERAVARWAVQPVISIRESIVGHWRSRCAVFERRLGCGDGPWHLARDGTRERVHRPAGEARADQPTSGVGPNAGERSPGSRRCGWPGCRPLRRLRRCDRCHPRACLPARRKSTQKARYE